MIAVRVQGSGLRVTGCGFRGFGIDD